MTPSKNGLFAFEQLGHYLKNQDWQTEALAERFIYTLTLEGKNGVFRAIARIRPDIEQFMFYVIAPQKAESAMRPEVMAFVTRVNYGLRIGNFEMDLEDGEVRYKSSIDFDGEPLTPNLLRNTIYPAIHTMDSYWPRLQKVLDGTATAVTALQQKDTS